MSWKLQLKRTKLYLFEHKSAVTNKISQVDSQIQALPNLAPESVALEKKKASLVEEEMQIEGALLNEEQFRISQSALKKDEYYELGCSRF